jgi:hypothetical protein
VPLRREAGSRCPTVGHAGLKMMAFAPTIWRRDGEVGRERSKFGRPQKLTDALICQVILAHDDAAPGTKPQIAGCDIVGTYLFVPACKEDPVMTHGGGVFHVSCQAPRLPHSS